MIPGLKKPISVSSRSTHTLRKALLPAAIVLMALAFSCTRQSEEPDAPDRSLIKIGFFGDLTGPTFNFGKSAYNGVLMAAAAVVLLARGAKARALSKNPVWIRGILQDEYGVTAEAVTTAALDSIAAAGA